MSSLTSPVGPQQNARRQRRALRTSTTILPSTGERVKRRVSLPFFGLENGTPQTANSTHVENAPLLPADDASSQNPGWLHATILSIRTSFATLLAALCSRNSKLILKCSTAYLLGSLCTFVPFISDWLGEHQHGKHTVATITVYFHAARTTGSMMEATAYAFIAFLYAAFLSFASMGVSIFFADRGLMWVGHLIVLFVFLGAGLAYVAWIKLRLANPLVNTACSLTALCAITVFIKEGSIQQASFSEVKVVQALKMVILGIAIVFLTNLLIFPERAHDKLNDNLTKSTDYLGALLTVISRSFLVGSEAEMQSKPFEGMVNAHEAGLKALNTSLAESKWEDYVSGHEKRYHVETELVKCVHKLSQDIGALRSAALMQFDLIRSTLSKDSGSTPVEPSIQSSVLAASMVAEPDAMANSGLHPINEEPDSAIDLGPVTPLLTNSPIMSLSPSVAQLQGRGNVSPADMFSIFISQLGPSMRSLVTTLVLVLDELPFESDVSDRIAINENFHASLHAAVDVFNAARRNALDVLYRNKDIYTTQSIERLADYEEIAASCGHFSFGLLDIAEEIDNYLELLEDLKFEQDASKNRVTYEWLKFWRRRNRLEVVKNPDDRLLHEEQHNNEDGPSGNPPTDLDGQQTPLEQFAKQQTFPNPAAPLPTTTTASPPVSFTRKQDFFYRIWRVTMFFARDDIRFAGKVGVGAALLAAPAFIDATRDTYLHYRLEWGLVSYMIVCSMTIGAVNTSSIERFIGTSIGAVFAVLGWIVTDAQAVPLAAFGWAMSLGCFYMVLVLKRGPMGRFIFLTYNLSALYAYSLSVQADHGIGDDDDADEGGINPHIWEIVLHRVVAVTVGCLWAIVVTRLIWPISARRKLKQGISLLWLRMALIWKRDPLSLVLGSSGGGGDNPHAPTAYNDSKMMDIREEASLRAFLTSLDGLRAAAEAEFELRGPFPGSSMAVVLERTRRMLDNFHGVNVVLAKRSSSASAALGGSAATQGEMAVLRATAAERAQLSGRISHLFSVLASCVRLEFPLHRDVLPDIDHSRDRLLAKVFEFRRGDEGRTASDVDFEMIYAYVLATGQLAKDISAIIRELEMLYGTLNEDNFRFN